MSFDRNGECWCGSGKKYKKCHMAFDDKLELYKKRGFKVPPHSMIKTPSQIEGIKKAAVVNNGLLDYIEERIKPGITTQDIDDWACEYLEANNLEPKGNILALFDRKYVNRINVTFNNARV